MIVFFIITLVDSYFHDAEKAFHHHTSFLFIQTTFFTNDLVIINID